MISAMFSMQNQTSYNKMLYM